MGCNVILYLPSKEIHEKMRQERVSLTPARAMLLDMMIALVSYGLKIGEQKIDKK